MTNEAKPTCGYCCDCKHWDAQDDGTADEQACLLPVPDDPLAEEFMSSWSVIFSTPRFGCVRFEAAKGVEEPAE